MSLEMCRETAMAAFRLMVSVHPLPFTGSAVSLAAILAGGTPAIPAGVNAYDSWRVQPSVDQPVRDLVGPCRLFRPWGIAKQSPIVTASGQKEAD